MDDPIFDSITVLVYAAEQEGFAACADALELVLDLYLLEREHMFPAIPMFVSKRAQRARDIADWTTDLKTVPSAGWSMDSFPMMRTLQVG